jgi:ribosome modulation factor
MAGKLHKDFQVYSTSGDGQPLVPGSKMVKAYADGYQAQRAGALQAANPFGAPVDNVDNNARAWDQGWRDANAGNPPTHVGGATGVPQVEEEPAARSSRSPRRPSRASDEDED